MKKIFFRLFASMLVLVGLNVVAQPSGQFYLYNSAQKVFLSRSASLSDADSFGLPFEIKASDQADAYSLMFMDNGCYVSPQGDAVASLTSPAYAIFEAAEGGYTVKFEDGRYLSLSAEKQLQAQKETPSVWQLLTQAQRDEIVSQQFTQQMVDVAKSASLNLTGASNTQEQFDAYIATLTSEDVSDLLVNPSLATSLNGWTANVLAGGANLSYKSGSPMTLYQSSAVEVSQTVSVPNGIYKATIQSTYRAAERGYLAKMYDQEKKEGISICNAYFAANDNKVLATEWAKIRTSDDKPYSRSDFENFPSNPLYTSTVWVYVNDGKLTVKFVSPSINDVRGVYDINWFVFGNVTLTRYYDPFADALSQLDLYNDLAMQAEDPSAYDAVVNDMKQQIRDKTADISKIKTMQEQLKTEVLKLIQTQPAKMGQYDITSFITNPSFDSGTKGWSRLTSSKFVVNSGIAESFGSGASSDKIYQMLRNMPAGKYTLKVQGFYRPSEWKQALANYERGNEQIRAYIYAGSAMQPLKSIFEDGCYMLKARSPKSADIYAVVSGRGFPHSHYIGSDRNNPIKTPDVALQAFQHGHYWNSFDFELEKDGLINIGVQLKTGGAAENWIAIDNFRLYYGTPSPITIITGEPVPVKDDTYADVILKHHFTAGVMTPFVSPCDIPASKFKAVYAIGSLDENTQTAIVYPVPQVRANVPCYVVAAADMDEIKIENTVIRVSLPEEYPVLWDGGVICPVENATTWRTKTVSEEEYDAAYFTNIKIEDDPLNMTFTTNMENVRVRQFLDNTSYPEPETPSVIENYFLPSPGRLDHPHSVGIPVPVMGVTGATVEFGLKSDFSDAQTRTILDGSEICYIPNLIPGNTYYYIMRTSEEVLSKGQFKVEGTVRMIYAPSISNIRDIGGWTVQDGKVVRYGWIYRGGEANGLHPSNAADRQTLIDLGIGAEIDLRKDNNYDSGKGEVGKCAFGFPATDFFFREGGYDCKLEHLVAADSKARYKEWFSFILRKLREGKAVYYHCVWGADRTGLVSVLLEGLLGFSQEQMNKEYELTSLSFAGLRPKSGYADGDHQKLIEKIKTYEGATLRDKFDTYWTQEVGISMEQIEEFRTFMLMDSTETAIQSLTSDQNLSSVIRSVFTPAGVKLSPESMNIQRGVYIIQYENGTSGKVIVK